MKRLLPGGLARARLLRTSPAANHAQSPPSPPLPEPGLRALALAESAGRHSAFTQAARPRLRKCGEANGFEVDHLTNTAPVADALLPGYQLVLPLDLAPYGGQPEAMPAFRSYSERGRGGRVGLRHAALLDEFDGHPIWTWLPVVTGKNRHGYSISTFASGTVRSPPSCATPFCGRPDVTWRSNGEEHETEPGWAGLKPHEIWRDGSSPAVWTNPRTG